MKFFNARKTAYHTNARLIDEAIYTPYSYGSRSSLEGDKRFQKHEENTAKATVGDLLGIPELQNTEEPSVIPGSSETMAKDGKKRKKFDQGGATAAEIFMFNYGTVVIWGMTEMEEKRFLSSMYVLTPDYINH